MLLFSEEVLVVYEIGTDVRSRAGLALMKLYIAVILWWCRADYLSS
jgi:hypothetical protein